MEYFIIENGQQAGPFGLDQLAQKHITQETLVWCEGMVTWTPAWQVDALKPLFYPHTDTNGTAAGVPPVPPPPHADKSPHRDRKKKQNHHLLPKVILGALVVVVAVLALTNPDREAHRTAVKKQLHAVIDKSGEDILGDNILAMGLRSIAQMVSGSVIDAAFDEFFEYHNYVLFSNGTVNFNGEDHHVSFGILGKVYTFNADDVIRAIDDNDSDATRAESQLDKKVNQVVDKVGERVSQKVEEKINRKLDELTDSSTLDKIIDKIFGGTEN